MNDYLDKFYITARRYAKTYEERQETRRWWGKVIQFVIGLAVIIYFDCCMIDYVYFN